MRDVHENVVKEQVLFPCELHESIWGSVGFERLGNLICCEIRLNPVSVCTIWEREKFLPWLESNLAFHDVN
jgi:hypothetical protein